MCARACACVQVWVLLVDLVIVISSARMPTLRARVVSQLLPIDVVMACKFNADA